MSDKREEIGIITLHINGFDVDFKLESKMLTADEINEIIHDNLTRDISFEDMKERFQPEWHHIFEDFYVYDTICVPDKIIQTEYYDLKTCRNICEIMNKLNVSYLAAILNAQRLTNFYKNLYNEVKEENKKLKQFIIDKALDEKTQ